jgi:hypothetical protein
MRIAIGFDHRGVVLRASVQARFDGGERYVRRLEKLAALERRAA